MPFLRLKTIREMTVKAREEKITELKAELLRLRVMVKAGGAIENPSRIKEIRKAIARILTIENEEAKK